MVRLSNDVIFDGLWKRSRLSAPQEETHKGFTEMILEFKCELSVEVAALCVLEWLATSFFIVICKSQEERSLGLVEKWKMVLSTQGFESSFVHQMLYSLLISLSLELSCSNCQRYHHYLNNKRK
ncbi:hypothetical protein HPP92_014423 [Vanilla planifolia]|uniref:Uncharacterized protein n=1 Tax=Vanilla planifolia TaxID=51239 RepID=A0A835QTU3_VANPL|nr:hypothetical protein HPP92_014423 [Vanilla planifolia]